ncbi:serine hydrolase domain-containing protein [Massilia sp.]|uniref:serine hydrolase domain-containing protein n=1 Tax=Massilia sp. TaxID=1882437 RepID=UPI00289B5108|nr:serine hydrolase domain-containing protein [Massilia sp.]
MRSTSRFILYYSTGLALATMLLTSQTAFSQNTSFGLHITTVMAEAKIPSVAIASIKGGRIVQISAFGEQSPGIAATESSTYNIASLTKPLTAEVVLRLASKKMLGLDEPMFYHWTDPDVSSDVRSQALTARFALSHQAGLPNWRDSKTGMKFIFDPGTQWGYSGEGYQYVLRFSEKKTGKSFDILARSQLFEPGGMTHTTFTDQPWLRERIALPSDALGKYMKPHIAERPNAADLVYATAADYASFMIEVIQDKGLSSEVASERRRIQVDLRNLRCAGDKAATCPERIGFGLGWEILDFAGDIIFMHTGKDDGVFTFAYLSKSTQDGVVILTNGDSGHEAVLPVLEKLGANPRFLAYLQAQVH